MYLINTHINGNSAKYPEDFPMLINGKTFAMIKQGNDFIIQTTESDVKKLKKLIETEQNKYRYN